MKPQTKVYFRDSFYEVDVTEPGYNKNINANVYSNNFMQPKEMEFNMQDVICDFNNKFWCLDYYISWDAWNAAISLGSGNGYTYSADFDVVSRQDNLDKYLYYPYTTSTLDSVDYYPWSVTSDAIFDDDQGIAIELSHAQLGEGEIETGCLFIAISGVTPNILCTVGTNLYIADTIIFEFPLYEKRPIRYGLTRAEWVTTSINALEDICYENVYNLDDNPTNIQNWLRPDTPHLITFRRVWNSLLVDSTSIGLNKSLSFSNSESFSLVNSQVRIIQTVACPLGFRIGDICYRTSGAINIKIPINTTSTMTPTLDFDYYNTETDATSTVTATLESIDGLYFKGKLSFANTNIKYTPILYSFNVNVPAKYTNTAGGAYTEISSFVVGWNITKNTGSPPSAIITFDNSVFDYSYTDFVNMIGKQLRIDVGYDTTGYNTRFTGVIESVDFSRNSAASCQVKLTCKGLSSRLDKEAMYERIYDGEYHQRAIADICQMAYIPNIITEAPGGDIDKLGYGINTPKYKIEAGETYRSLVNKILAFSGFVLEEDELGQLIYAKKYWRYYDFETTVEEYGNADVSTVAIEDLRVLNTTNYGFSGGYYRTPVSSLQISRNHNDLRNTVIVIGQADRFIDYQYQWYPAFKPGDPIVCFKENTDLIAKMGQKQPIVIRDSSLSHPDTVEFVAETLLAAYSDIEQQAQMTVLGDENFYIGSINLLEDNVMIGTNMFFVIEGMNENFDNNIYLMELTGILKETIPVQYG